MKKLKLTKARTLTLYVVFSFLMLIVYTIVEFIVSSITGISHDTLTTCFFAAFGGEVLSCALLKVMKIKKGDVE